MLGMSRGVPLDGLSDSVRAQVLQISQLFWGLHMSLLMPVLFAVAAGVIPFSLCAMVQQNMELGGRLVTHSLDVLVSVLLYTALPVTALVMVLLKRWKYNSRYVLAAEDIKNALGQHPELQEEALEVLRARDGFVDRHAKLLGL